MPVQQITETHVRLNQLKSLNPRWCNAAIPMKKEFPTVPVSALVRSGFGRGFEKGTDSTFCRGIGIEEAASRERASERVTSVRARETKHKRACFIAIA